MADCREQAVSNEFYDFIVPYGLQTELMIPESCVQRISEEFDIYFFDRELIPPIDLANYTYLGLPKCYGLLDTSALEASGILRLQDQPVLSLRGNGVLVGFIDTGIDYTNNLFRYSDGSTRIAAIWDQTIQTGTPPAGIVYGSEYRTEDINRALISENPYAVVPSRDEDGHGTFLAGVACGSEDPNNDFIGAAPGAQIAVVKLKDRSDAAAMMDSLHGHVKARQGTFAEYDPEQVPLTESAVVTREGRYVVLIVSKKNGLVQNEFQKFFQAG